MHLLGFELDARALLGALTTALAGCGADTPELADTRVASDPGMGQQAPTAIEAGTGAAADAAAQGAPAQGLPTDPAVTQPRGQDGEVLEPCAGTSVTARAELLPTDAAGTRRPSRSRVCRTGAPASRTKLGGTTTRPRPAKSSCVPRRAPACRRTAPGASI